VLVVPVYGQNAASTLFLCVFLRQRGFEWVWAVNGRRGTLADRAALLAGQIDRLRAASGSPTVDIVGHGIGGLVAAELAQDPQWAEAIRRLVAVGSPWRGTRMAVFASQQPGPAILYGAHNLEHLIPPPVPTVCVWSPDDPLVVPARSAAVEGADEVRIDGAGHLDLLASPRGFRAIETGLTTALAESA
jgi:pimeloyl-ACP methyl ester carboxylesterase